MISPYYDDGQCVIYCGDTLEVFHEVRNNHCPVGIVMDPPYGISWSKGLNRKKSSRAHDGIKNDRNTNARDFVLSQIDNLPAATFGSLYLAPPVTTKHILVWEKPGDAGVVGSTLGFRRDIEAIYLTGVWPRRPAKWGSVVRSSLTNIGSPSSPAGITGHPHAKPTDIIARLIDLLPAGSTMDPFMGSGTTLVAAKQLGRMAVGIEIEEHYCEIAAKRLAQQVITFD